MIRLSRLSKSFGNQTLFEDITFGINRRERIGLVGRNGHGKTTLFRMILGETGIDGGEIIVPRRYRIGHLDQELRFTADNIVDETCLGLPPDRSTESWKAEKILFGLGFTQEDLAKHPSIFSGGFQVRLNLAKVLIAEPDLLLLDEPTNYLDVVSIRWLTRFLRTWPNELMIITHDRSFMDGVVTHTVAIHRQRAKKIEGDTGKLYEQILKEEEIYEKTRLNDEKKRKEIERFVDRFRAKNTLATRVQSRIKYLEKHKALDRLEAIQTLEFSFNAAPFPAKTMLRAESMSFGYDADHPLFGDFSLDIHRHDRICVMGQNGRGKSTLLRLLAEELTPDNGGVSMHPKTSVGYFAQTNTTSMAPRRTVVEEIQAADGGCLPQTARNVAGAMMFEGDRALKKISVLSGGEKSRVMLGKLIVSPANLLLLDEPTNHLDMDSCDSLLAAVDAFDGAVVMVTHNEMFLHSLATRFVVFDRGGVFIYDRSYADFLKEVGWELDESLAVRPAKAASAEPRVTVDKKALRQARAKISAARSRAIGPLQKKVAAEEKRIKEMEATHAKALAELERASLDGDVARIAELARAHTDLRADIDSAYDTLAEATDELERESARFDRELEHLS